MTAIKLTKEQRDQIDEQVLSCIQGGIARQTDIATDLDSWLVANMPTRVDRYRYVDQSVQRLKRDKRIKLAGHGHYGWKATGKS